MIDQLMGSIQHCRGFLKIGYTPNVEDFTVFPGEFLPMGFILKYLRKLQFFKEPFSIFCEPVLL
jgi:hypothetical protein